MYFGRIEKRIPMTEEKYIDFKTAILLKNIGFTWPYLDVRNSYVVEESIPLIFKEQGNAKPPFFNTCYNNEGKEITPKLYNPKNSHYPRPTLAMACDWIEENFGIFIHVDICPTGDGENKIKNEFSGVARGLKENKTFFETYSYGDSKNGVMEEILKKVLGGINVGLK